MSGAPDDDAEAYGLVKQRVSARFHRVTPQRETGSSRGALGGRAEACSTTTSRAAPRVAAEPERRSISRKVTLTGCLAADKPRGAVPG